MIAIGAIHLYWYGLIISFAIVAGLFFTWLNTKLRHENFSIVLDIILYSIPVSIICSRIFFVCLHHERFADNFTAIFALTRGGLSIYGAFTGFLLVLYFYTRRHNLSFWHWLDILAPGLIFGLMLIQVSNFCLQCSIGVPFPVNSDNRSLAEYIVYRHRPAGFESYMYFRPIALYQAFALAVIFIFSMLLTAIQVRLEKLHTGNIFIFSMFLAALIRFIGGFFYLSMQGGWLHLGQYFSLFGMLLLIIVYFYRKRHAQN